MSEKSRTQEFRDQMQDSRDRQITITIRSWQEVGGDWSVSLSANKDNLFVWDDLRVKGDMLNPIETEQQALALSQDLLLASVAKMIGKITNPELDETAVLRSSLRKMLGNLGIGTVLHDGWDDCLDDDDWGFDQSQLEAVRFGPGFTDQEREHAAKLSVNDENAGGGLSLFGRTSGRDYSVYPLRSGAFALAVSNEGDATYVMKYDDQADFIGRHGPHKISDEDRLEQLMTEVVRASGGTWHEPEDEDTPSL